MLRQQSISIFSGFVRPTGEERSEPKPRHTSPRKLKRLTSDYAVHAAFFSLWSRMKLLSPLFVTSCRFIPPTVRSTNFDNKHYYYAYDTFKTCRVLTRRPIHGQWKTFNGTVAMSGSSHMLRSPVSASCCEVIPPVGVEQILRGV